MIPIQVSWRCAERLDPNERGKHLCMARKGLSMAKKSWIKKQKFQAFCREQVVKNGLINHADGLWRPAQSGKAMDAHMRAGYKVR